MIHPPVELLGTNVRVLVEQTTAVDPQRLGDLAGRLSQEELFASEALTLMGTLENVARDLSAGTESVAVDWTAKPTSTVQYFADGSLMTMFEASTPSYRSGRLPDRFVAQMRQVGSGPSLPSRGRRRRRRSTSRDGGTSRNPAGITAIR